MSGLLPSAFWRVLIRGVPTELLADIKCACVRRIQETERRAHVHDSRSVQFTDNTKWPADNIVDTIGQSICHRLAPMNQW